MAYILALLMWGGTILAQDGVEWKYDDNQPPLLVSPEFVVKGVKVIDCESGWNDDTVGSQGERGYLQIHPVHRGEMAEHGLEFDNTHDRMVWGYVLYKRGRWTPWLKCGA